MNGLREIAIVHVNVVIADRHENSVRLELVAVALLQTARYYSAKYYCLPITLDTRSKTFLFHFLLVLFVLLLLNNY